MCPAMVADADVSVDTQRAVRSIRRMISPRLVSVRKASRPSEIGTGMIRVIIFKLCYADALVLKSVNERHKVSCCGACEQPVKISHCGVQLFDAACRPNVDYRTGAAARRIAGDRSHTEPPCPARSPRD